MAKATHTSSWRGQYSADEKNVLQLIGIDYGALMMFKADVGREWFINVAVEECGYSAEDAADLWLLPDVLGWWNLEWRRTDHFVILPVLYKFSEEHRLTEYVRMHTDVLNPEHPNYLRIEKSLVDTLARIVKQPKRTAA